MSNLEDVIARSRAPGSFSERKRFTVARAAAVRKMRQFSLVSPYFYILELVQSAIANGATYIDLSIEQSFVGVSYVGGGFTADELGSLFDFLFASKADIDTADLRQLALGLNVLMLTEPELIVVESGDGTLEGTTRIDIRPRQETVDVGTPDKALKGTFISAKGINRKLLARFENAGYNYMKFPELAVLSERCLCTPVPLIVNNEALHGYGAMRAPVLYGYSRVLSFDEGDLYGTIGIAGPAGTKLSSESKHMAELKLLTWGVWVQSVDDQPFPDVMIGGVLNFNSLNKTADHAAIVRDERLDELFARLRPWIDQLKSGKKSKQATYNVRPLDGQPLTSRELRVLLASLPYVVSVPELDPQSERATRARQIGAALDAPVFICGDSDAAPMLRALGGPKLRVILPDLSSPADALFFSQPPLPAPEGAWACAPIEVPALAALEVARAAGAATNHPFPNLLAALGGALSPIGDPAHLPRRLTGVPAERHAAYLQGDYMCAEALHARIYTPLDGAPVDGAQVELVSAERLLWSGALPASTPGLLLRVEVPQTAMRATLLAPLHQGGPPAARYIAHTILSLCEDALVLAAQQAIDGLMFHPVAPGTRAAQLALAAMARGAVWRLDHADGAPQLSLELVGAANTRLLDLPVFKTLDGAPRSMRELTSRHRRGLVYGVCEGVPADLDGIDTSDLLSLTPAEEAMLVQCIGEACYVRVDGRDVLSEVEGACLRDIAVGLRADYPADLPLLAEGPRADDPAVVDALVSGLIGELLAPLPAKPTALALERRRQLLRHMQWCAVHSMASGQPRLERLGLFADQDGHMRTLTELLDAARRHGALLMNGGVAQDMWLTRPPQAPADPPRLTMNPFALSLLAQLVPVQPSLVVPAEHDGAAPDALVSVSVEGARGRLHLTRAAPRTAAIGVYSADRQRLDLYTGRWARLGVVGEVTRAGDPASLEAALAEGSGRLFEALLQQLEGHTLEPADHERALTLLFGVVSEQLRLIRTPQGVSPVVGAWLAQRILALPLFDAAHGRPVSGMRLIEEFCAAQQSAEPTHGTALSDALSPALSRWLAQTLVPERILNNKPAPQPSPPADAARPAAQMRRGRLEGALNRWLALLNPASWAMPEVRLVGMMGAAADGEGAQWRERIHDEMFSEGEVFRLQGSEERHILFIRADAYDVAKLFDSCLTEPRALAWLILAIYGHINYVFQPVTNEHELELHQRVARALLAGELVAE